MKVFQSIVALVIFCILSEVKASGNTDPFKECTVKAYKYDGSYLPKSEDQTHPHQFSTILNSGGHRYFVSPWQERTITRNGDTVIKDWENMGYALSNNVTNHYNYSNNQRSLITILPSKAKIDGELVHFPEAHRYKLLSTSCGTILYVRESCPGADRRKQYRIGPGYEIKKKTADRFETTQNYYSWNERTPWRVYAIYHKDITPAGVIADLLGKKHLRVYNLKGLGVALPEIDKKPPYFPTWKAHINHTLVTRRGEWLQAAQAFGMPLAEFLEAVAVISLMSDPIPTPFFDYLRQHAYMAYLGKRDIMNGVISAEAIHRIILYGQMFPLGFNSTTTINHIAKDPTYPFNSTHIRDHGIAATVANFRDKVNQELLAGMRMLLAELLIEPEQP